MTGDRTEFGARLRTLRTLAGLSQDELAERSGLSARAISNLERGRSRWPYPSTLHRLADALELSGTARTEFTDAPGRRLGLRLGVPGTATADEQSRGWEDERPVPAGAAPQPAVPRELPGAVAGFTGRTRELGVLTRLLGEAGEEPTRTVVISAIGGSAGVGKTALAVHWAHQVADLFPDGQLYVNLRGYSHGQAVTAADALAGFLRALGVPGRDIPADADQRAALYRSLLAGRRTLIVLDNARSVKQVRPLLPGTPASVTVVTSRDSLVGLVARDGARRLNLDVLLPDDAISLLKALIGARADTDPAATAELAQQCAWLPLALRLAAELAVARPAVSLADLIAELSDEQRRLDLLDADGDADTAIRAVFSWSLEYLDAETARAFRLLSLHPGPRLDRYATAALIGAIAERAGQMLDRLGRVHLIQLSHPARYGMHDLLRAYARQLTVTQDTECERRAALTRVFDYYLHAAATAMDTLFPAEQRRRPPVTPSAHAAPPLTEHAQALAWLDAERDNLVAATDHTAEHGWPGHTIRLAAILFRYLNIGSHFPEALTVQGNARKAAARIGDRAAEATALTSLGTVHGQQGQFRQATDCLQQALVLHREAGDRTGEARTLANLGGVDFLQGHYERAAEHVQAALALHLAVGDRNGEAHTYCNLGEVDLRRGRYQQAASHLQEALALFQEFGDPNGQAAALASLGDVDLRRGRCPQAAANHRQALGLFREAGNRTGEAMALNGLAEAYLADGKPGDAVTSYATALRLASETSEKSQQARAHHGLARAYRISGNVDEAHCHLDKALDIYAELKDPQADQVRAERRGMSL